MKRKNHEINTLNFTNEMRRKLCWFLRNRQQERIARKSQTRWKTIETRFRHKRRNANRSLEKTKVTRINQKQQIWHDYFRFSFIISNARFGQFHQIQNTNYFDSQSAMWRWEMIISFRWWVIFSFELVFDHTWIECLIFAAVVMKLAMKYDI